MDAMSAPTPAQAIATTRDWLEKVVIGLNLCPFAKAVHVQDRIRYRVSDATTTDALRATLREELEHLAAADPETCETTLLIHPHVLEDFFDYNDFLSVAERTVKKLKLDGVLQVASFHPQYQFADAAPDSIENYTNRSPWPMLHLLRESSIERAIDSVPDAADIYTRNIATLRRIGLQGWRALGIADAQAAMQSDQPSP